MKRKTLRIVVNVLGNHFSNRKEYTGGKLQVFDKIIACTLILILILVYVWILIDKSKTFYQTIPGMAASLDALADTFMVVINTTAIYSTGFGKKDVLDDFKSKTKAVENFLKFRFSASKQFRATRIKLVILFVLLLCSYCYNLYTAFTKKSFILKYYVFLVLNQFMIGVVVLKLRNTLSLLDKYFRLLNNKLAVEWRVVSKNDEIRAFARMHQTLCELTRAVNARYGMRVLGIVNLIALYIIRAVYLIVRITISENRCHIASQFVIIENACTSLLFLVFGIMIASSCELVIKSATDTAQICHKLLLECPLNGDDKDDPQGQLLQEELLLLAHQVTHLKPKFTAADFFTVNYSMLYGMLGSIVSYIVIIIQL